MRTETERKHIAMRQAVTYGSEYNDTLVRLLKENAGLASLKYFLDVAYYWSEENNRKAMHRFRTNPGSSTTDKVFLLSIKEKTIT